MAKCFAFIFFLVSFVACLSQEASAAATPKPPQQPPPPLPSSFEKVFTCLKGQLSKLGNDISGIVQSNPVDSVCGAKTMSNMSDAIGKAIQKGLKCADVSCCLTILPLIKAELLATGIECANQFTKNGPFVYAMNGAYETLTQCVIHQLA